MKICIFGATGKTGLQLIEQGLVMGLDITAYVRNPENLSTYSDKITIIEGSLEDEAKLKMATKNQDAIISALGVFDRKPHTILSDATSKIIEAMKANKMRRLIVITSLGCRESLSQVKAFIFRELIVKRIAKQVWADKNRQEERVEASELDYTIVRPGGLRDAPATSNYKVVEQGEPVPKKTMIARGDVADFILKIMNDKKTYSKTYVIVGANQD